MLSRPKKGQKKKRKKRPQAGSPSKQHHHSAARPGNLCDKIGNVFLRLFGGVGVGEKDLMRQRSAMCLPACVLYVPTSTTTPSRVLLSVVVAVVVVHRPDEQMTLPLLPLPWHGMAD